VDCSATGGGAPICVIVSLAKPHQNSFSGIVGMRTWGVATTASALFGYPNTVIGAMPITFNRNALDVNGFGTHTNGIEHIYDEPPSGSQDIPLGSTVFNWTEYCDLCNADSATVDSLINAHGYSTQVKLTDKITPLNAGAHTALFDDVAQWVGQDFPIPLVNDAGQMVGWAMFHLTGSSGGSTKQIRGWFVSPINDSSMTITADGGAGANTGDYVVQLVN
jgi:hypothetical protein